MMPQKRILYTKYGAEADEEAAKKIVGGSRRFDAVIFTEDLTAVYAMNALQNMGYRIPEDVAVVGCNNSEYSRISNPPLTTINNKGELLSELSVQLLENLMTGKSEKASLIIRPNLRSVRRPRHRKEDVNVRSDIIWRADGDVCREDTGKTP